MPIALDVENQRFTFGPAWVQAFKYDDTTYYRNGPERLKGELTTVEQPSQEISIVPQSTKAVDVVALHNADGLLLLEAKDFRGQRIANKKRITSNEVALEVGLKVPGYSGGTCWSETYADHRIFCSSLSGWDGRG